MTVEKKFEEITKLAQLYLDGALTVDECLNQIVMITHNTLTTEEFYQR